MRWLCSPCHDAPLALARVQQCSGADHGIEIRRCRHVEVRRLSVDGRDVRLTNLRKVFWPDLGITKGDLIQYYADVASVLLPHIHNRAMVMKRYPNGVEALRVAQDTPYGLAAAVWTDNLGAAHRISRALKAGLATLSRSSARRVRSST